MESTNIYFIGSVEGGAVKIGKSNNPEKRLAELQTGSSSKLFLYGVINNVKEEYELRLHRIFDHLRLEGEWFKLTDELIQFMVNIKNKASSDFRINNPYKTDSDLLKLAIDKIVIQGNYLRDFLNERYLVEHIRNYLIYIGESPQFDIKKLKRIMESIGIYKTTKNGEWGYHGYRVNIKNIYADHYLYPVSMYLSLKTVEQWDKVWKEMIAEDSEKWKNIKFSQGYSIFEYEDGIPLLETLTSTALAKTREIEKVIIYKGGIYDARCFV